MNKQSAKHQTYAFQGKTPMDAASNENAKTITLTIDDESISVPQGSNVLEAAKRLSIDISSFCYHPGLSIAAVCRQCLVSIEGVPKLQPSCQAICQEGMVVRTQDEQSMDARRQMLEFTLVNHPIDCPICDRAGDCTLQKMYFEHDYQLSKIDVPKVRKPKAKDIGKHIMLDAERCILCTRCIRVCDEVANEHQLTMINRGDKQELTTTETLDNPYSLNTVDVCPVGALTEKEFRFSMRSWELMMTPSVCSGCSTGCNIEIHHRNTEVYRIKPRYHKDINKHWMCDEGRSIHKQWYENRLTGPMREGIPVSWEDAMTHAGHCIKTVLDTDCDSIGVVFSPHHTNEANYLLYKLTQSWGVKKLFMGGAVAVPDRADDILMDQDVTPNRQGVISIVDAGLEDTQTLISQITLGTIKTLIVLGSELDVAPMITDSSCQIIVFSEYETDMVSNASVAFPISAWMETDGSVTNRDNHIQRIYSAMPSAGQSLSAWETLVRLSNETGHGLKYNDLRSVDACMRRHHNFPQHNWDNVNPRVQLRFEHSRG